MAASSPLPVTQDLSTLRAKLQGLLRFLREALCISSAHTVDFYTESVWEQLIDLPPETVLAVLKKSTEEPEARPSEARHLVDAERASGKWRGREGRTGRQREGPVRHSGLFKGPEAEAGERRGGAGRAWAGPARRALGKAARRVLGLGCGRCSRSLFRLWLHVCFHNSNRTRDKAGRSFSHSATIFDREEIRGL